MDIDIDIHPDADVMSIFKGIITKASQVTGNQLVKHNVGTYFQTIPIDPITGFSAIPYKEADEYGYFKFGVESKEQMNELIELEPDWKLLEDREVVKKLWQVSNWFDFVDAVKPTSVLELADLIALIRPNKQNLLDKYLRNRKAMRKELYTQREPKDYKKSHAIPYALLIVMQLNLIRLGKL
jgi:glycyl-tRNA synthetase alpha subunit